MKWSRREWLALAAGSTGLISKLGGVEATGTNPPDTYYRDYSRCVPDYLGDLARQAYEKRNRELQLLANVDAIQKRQVWARNTFWNLVGGEPQRTPLNARVAGKFERARYQLQKVVYESRPGVVVSANLYIPQTHHPPYPGVLFQMGHSPLGKAYEPYQRCCQGLAQLGYLVLAFDPIGQGERIGYPDPSGTGTRLGSATAEHSLPGKQMVLLGDTASRHQVWDAIRSLDYLAAHPLVDPERLASTGQSGGGTLTMLLSCADARLSVAAVSSGNTEDFACAHFDSPGSTDDAEQDFINSGPVGFDRWDLLYPFAPKPLLILVSEHDFFGTYSPRYLDDGRSEFKKLANVYKVLGHSDRLSWQSTPLPHGLTYDLRVKIYNWFERWLKNSEKRIEQEPPTQPEPANILWVGASGNVARDYGSLRPFDLVRKRTSSASIATSSSSWRKSLPDVPPLNGCKLRMLGSARLAGTRVFAAEVNSAPHIWVPAWVFVPDKQDPNRPVLIALDDRGRNAQAGEGHLYHKLAQTGQIVCAADIRDIGDMQPEVGRGNPGYMIPHEKEEANAWAALILGIPLLSQRITDIVALAQALGRSDSVAANHPIALAARGRLTVPSLFAFHACRKIDALYLAGGLMSYQNLLQTEMYNQPLSNFAWNLLISPICR
jgi:dienelactone hydrolase